MCAIVGIISKDKLNTTDFLDIDKMCSIMNHRGPDDFGKVVIDADNHFVHNLLDNNRRTGKAILGFDRLSIQDLSINGHQPMQNEDSTISIIFNGEIYNFLQLKDDLVKKGHIFKSNSDTEVILHLYMEYGIEYVLSKLNGMFSFAIADVNKGRIFIARDRFGIKPLYLAKTKESILFSSELKAFLKYSNFKPELNMETVQEYILFRSSLKNTLLKDVVQVEPGICLTYNLINNELSELKYFDVENYERSSDGNYENLKQKLWDTMRSAIKRQVISDVKVGCQLSGGIDSSILTKIVAEEHGLYDTVSCKVDCLEQSDAPYIDLVNDSLKAKSHIQMVNANVFVEDLIDVVWHFDGIMSHTPAVGMMEISKCAKKNDITVLLSGEGADELFGGYKYFTQLAFPEKELTKQEINDSIIFRDGKESESFLKNIMPDIKSEKFYQERLDCLNHFSGSSFDRQVKYELITQLPELLRRQDRMAMSYSVENRVPFLDNEMVDMAWSIPESFLISKSLKEGKYILKNIASELFGEDFAFRKKVGFFIPGNRFLGSNMSFINKVLISAKKRGILNYSILSCWADSKLQTYGGLNHFQSSLFLKLFTLEIWCMLFIDGISVKECKERLLY